MWISSGGSKKLSGESSISEHVTICMLPQWLRARSFSCHTSIFPFHLPSNEKKNSLPVARTTCVPTLEHDCSWQHTWTAGGFLGSCRNSRLIPPSAGATAPSLRQNHPRWYGQRAVFAWIVVAQWFPVNSAWLRGSGFLYMMAPLKHLCQLRWHLRP